MARIERKEIIKKVKRIEITTRRLVNTILSGEYRSSFKGRGMEFIDVREYNPGDDVRNIDWNVTARMNRPFVKQFAEERELSVLLVVDASSSALFGTKERSKLDVAAELSAVLAFSAIKNNDNVGLILFTDEVELFVPPRKGKKHVMRIIRNLVDFQPRSRNTDMNAALSFVLQVVKKRSIVFLISDFKDQQIGKIVAQVNQRHDLLALAMRDPAELNFTGVGLIELVDLESGQEILIDSSDRHFQKKFSQSAGIEQEAINRDFQRLGVDCLNLQTDSDYMLPLIHYLKKRSA